MEVFGPVMATGFAQTETGGPVTFMSPTDHARALEDNRVERFASCGKETLFARAEIMDDEGQMVPIGSEGELVVRSNHLMAGYFAGAATRPILPLEPGGWYRTGDIAFKDDEGFFYLRDRKREMIISRGYNIFTADIEKVIEGEAGVRACAVVGVPDDEMGERVVAVVESVPGRCIDSNHLLDVCRRRLAPQLMPVAIETWPSLPRSSAGKVVRRQVRDVFWKGRARKI
jgi:acyl-CoA synthetase (AMP-forming)/AMP-acid ligase II